MLMFNQFCPRLSMNVLRWAASGMNWCPTGDTFHAVKAAALRGMMDQDPNIWLRLEDELTFSAEENEGFLTQSAVTEIILSLF